MKKKSNKKIFCCLLNTVNEGAEVTTVLAFTLSVTVMLSTKVLESNIAKK